MSVSDKPKAKKRGTYYIRHNTSDMLNEYCEREGLNKSEVIADAVKLFLSREGLAGKEDYIYTDPLTRKTLNELLFDKIKYEKQIQRDIRRKDRKSKGNKERD